MILSLCPRALCDAARSAVDFRIAWEEKIFGKDFKRESHQDLGLVRYEAMEYYASLYEVPDELQ